MGLEFVKASDFKKGKENKWPKHKPKAAQENKKEDNDDWQCGGHENDTKHDDGEWIEVIKGSTN